MIKNQYQNRSSIRIEALGAKHDGVNFSAFFLMHGFKKTVLLRYNLYARTLQFNVYNPMVFSVFT